MIRINKLRLVFFLLVMMAARAYAEVPYTELLKSLTPNKKNIVSEVPELEALNNAGTLAEAQDILRGKLLESYPQTSSAIESNSVYNLVKQRQLTFVIVPGVLGEFIDVRAFEEIFARDSSFKREWNQRAGNMSLYRFDLKVNGGAPQKISELVNAASIDDANGNPMIKMIILKTFPFSLESVGSNVERAKIFNARIQQYVNMTGDQNLVLMGYSRGTPLALEMITQAENNPQLTYIKNVKALVSYAGVVSGSTLADDTDNLSSVNGKLLAAAIKMRNSLQLSEGFLDRVSKFNHNSAAIAEFLKVLQENTKVDFNALLNNARSGDFRTVAALIAKAVAELGLTTLYDFNGHVIRTQKFIDEVLTAVGGLKSQSMVGWWKTHTLPRNIQYLSLAASMVNKDRNAVEKQIFNSKEGYSDSLDDSSLLENMKTYEQLTGVAMNDSQVAVYQSLFLPNVIAGLNPANAGLNIKALGILQTHHWGVSLQVVNKMRDGRLNPFPREKVVLALAAYLNQ